VDSELEVQLEHNRIQQHKKKLTGDKWFVACVPLKAIRHNERRNLSASVLDYKAVFVSRSVSSTIQSTM